VNDRLVDVLLAEYAELKDEQRTRIKVRDNLPYVALALAGVAVTKAYDGGPAALILLLLGPALVILGVVYLRNDNKISEIGTYIAVQLAERLSAQLPGSPAVFEWERAHREVPGRRANTIMQLAIDLSVFCVIPLVSLTVFWIIGPHQVWLIVLSAFSTIAVGLLAAAIVRPVVAGKFTWRLP